MPLARDFIGWKPSLGLWIALVCAGCADEPFEDEGDGLAEFRSGPVDGLELHWTFEDRIGNQVLDISGKGRHGWLSGGSFVPSSLGDAVSLDGIDDSIAFTGPREPALYGGIDGNFTIHSRVRVANVAKYNTLCFGCGPFSTMFVGTEPYGARTMSAVLDKSNNGSLWPWSTQSLANDTWVDITMVVDGGTSARTYLDCAFDSQTTSANLGLKNYAFSAVGRGSVASRWYQGEIDDLRVWNRALTDEEIATICPPPPATLCEGPIHVDVDAPADGDGLTWATAFTNLQAAIDASLECEDPQLWVAEGSYAPNPNSPVATISAPVAIYGGFAGDEEALEERDVAAHVTRLGADDWNARVVLIQASAASNVEEVRLDGFTISGSNAGAIYVEGAFSGFDPPITATFENLEITDNIHGSRGAGIMLQGRAAIDVLGSRFEGNSGLQGGGILFQGGNQQGGQPSTLSVTNCEFVGNHAKSGGAIFLVNTASGDESVFVVDSTFTDNTATWGGAIALDDLPHTPSPIDLMIEGCEFTGNSAVQGGGAIQSEETIVGIHESVFVDNAAGFGGAIHVDNAHAATELPGWEINDSRFIGNQATVTGGGAMLLEEHEVTIVNTEFVSNSAVGGGGGIFGRATVVASTFAGNTGTVGSGVYAPPGGPLVAMRHIVAWPDKVFGNDIMLDYSCVAPTVNDDTIEPYVILASDPFDPADLDVDGKTEHYLASDSPCRDFAGISGELDWEGLTTQVSQCTDIAPSDAGVHYVPLFPAGECMGEGGDGDGDSSSTTDDGDSSSTTDDGGSSSTTDDGGSTSTSTSTTGDGDGDTGDGDGDGDGDCEDWTSIKTRAEGLDKVWTDGFDIIATGKGDLVKLADGQWQDIEATTDDRWMSDMADVWGPAVDDHWLLGFVQMKHGWGVFHHDGSKIDGHRLFPFPQTELFGQPVPIDLAGSGPDDIWATATTDCNTMACGDDPDCACNWAPSMLMHYDGVEWTDKPSPGLITRIWTDGTKVWGVGGRNVDDSPWLNPVPGLLASFNGSFWTVVGGDVLPPLSAVWSNDGEEVWVGGDDGTLRLFDGLDWEVHDLPTTATVVRIEGRSNSEIWALDDEGELHAYDGVAWDEWLSLPHVNDFAVMGDVLALVGELDGHVVEFVDIENESVDTVYQRRGDFYPATMVADDMQTAVASAVHHTGVPSTGGIWRWDGTSWTPTYDEFSPGFDKLLGDVDQGYATRYLNENEVAPDFHPTYQIVDGEIVELAPPAPNLRVLSSEVFTLDGQEQLWVGTATMDFDNPQYGLYARVDGAWVDRQPPGVTSLARLMTQGGQRVFVAFGATNISMFEAGNWTDISNPLNGFASSLEATGKFQLWMTSSSTQDGANVERLYFWGGGAWNIAKNLFPVLVGHEWEGLSARAPNDMWMISQQYSEAESLAHWNGQAWTLLDTPALLHGWATRGALLVEPTPDGVFIHDGIRLWRYEECAP